MNEERNKRKEDNEQYINVFSHNSEDEKSYISHSWLKWVLPSVFPRATQFFVSDHFGHLRTSKYYCQMIAQLKSLLHDFDGLNENVLHRPRGSAAVRMCDITELVQPCCGGVLRFQKLTHFLFLLSADPDENSEHSSNHCFMIVMGGMNELCLQHHV